MSQGTLDPAAFTVLVVDDEANNREMLSRRFEKRGFIVYTAIDGADALRRIDATGCDLVVLDLMMPVMSGFETLERIREKHGAADLPVIMATARTDAEAMLTCLNSGANDYVTKPLDFPVLLARVRSQLLVKSAVEHARRSEARFRLLADASPDMISQHTPDLRFRFASSASRSIFGLESDELEGRSLLDLMHPEDKAAVTAIGERPDACTLIVRLSHGGIDWRWSEVRVRSARGSRTGRVTDVLVSIRDVSTTIHERGAAPIMTQDGGFHAMGPLAGEPPVRRRPTVQ